MFITVLACLFTLVSVFVLGRLFLSYATDRVYSSGVAFFVGLCLLGIISMLLLFANAFDHLYLLGVVIAVVVIFGWDKRHAVYSFLERVCAASVHITASYPELALLVCLCVVVAVFIILNFVPLTATDGFGYHLLFVRDFILSHHINQPLAGLTFFGLGYFPGLSEIIFAAVTLISGLSSIVAPIIALQSGVLVALLWTLYKESAFIAPSRAARIIPLLVLMAAPDFRDIILWVGTIDLLVFSIIAVGVLLVVRGLYEQERIDLYLGALFLGSALAMKYHALFAAAYCALVVVVIFIWSPKVRQWLWRPALFSALIAMLVPLYWYVKNFVLFHNPIYPLLSPTGLVAAVQSHIYLPNTLWVKFFYPILVYMPFLFRGGGAYLAVAEAALAAVGVCGIIILFLKTRRLDFSIASLLGFILFYSWILSFLTDERRYNLPALIIFAVLDGAILQRLFDVYRPRVVMALSYIAALGFFVLLPFMMHSYGERLNVLRGEESANTYIISQTPDHSVAAYHALLDIP